MLSNTEHLKNGIVVLDYFFKKYPEKGSTRQYLIAPEAAYMANGRDLVKLAEARLCENIMQYWAESLVPNAPLPVAPALPVAPPVAPEVKKGKK